MFGRRDENVDRLFQNQEQLQRGLRELSRHVSRGTQIRQIDALKEIVVNQYGQAIAYTNLLLVAGYAALFTVWKEVKSDLPKGAMLLVGALALISAALFVLFELGKLIFSTVFHRQVGKALAVLGPNLVFDQNPIAALGTRFSERMYWWWVWMLIPTLSTGLGAVIVLVWNLIRGYASPP